MISRYLLPAFTIVLKSILALIFPVSAQTTDPYVNELLREINELAQRSDRSLNEKILLEGKQERVNWQQLSYNCFVDENIETDSENCQRKKSITRSRE
jgi:hypothetical protein